MINWFDMPAEGLSNGGLFEVKELEVTENATYETSGEMYNKVTVNVPSPTGKITITENGTDIDIAQYATADVAVEGGGSSDFSTAEVTVSNLGLYHITGSRMLIDEEYGIEGSCGDIFGSGASPETFTIILYKGKGYLATNAPVQSMSGDITYDEDLELYVVTGDSAITISGGQ